MTTGAIYLDAVLEPPRSLSAKGFSRVMLFVGSASFIFGLGFILVGAYPVAGFLGAEVLLLWLLFRRSFKKQKARTFVTVSSSTIDLRRIDAQGRERLGQLPTRFTKVALDEKARGANTLKLIAPGHTYAIGEHLTEKERRTLYNRIDDALRDARREQYQIEDDQ